MQVNDKMQVTASALTAKTTSYRMVGALASRRLMLMVVDRIKEPKPKILCSIFGRNL